MTKITNQKSHEKCNIDPPNPRPLPTKASPKPGNQESLGWHERSIETQVEKFNPFTASEKFKKVLVNSRARPAVLSKHCDDCIILAVSVVYGP